MIREILRYPNPALAEYAAPAVPGDDAKRILVDLMQTCAASNGMGLAAPQIGERIAAIVIHDFRSGTWHAMLNPRITKRSGVKITSSEGCLSIPERTIDVSRSWSVTVEAESGDGFPLRVDNSGLLAAAFQHECDHLRGVTILDHVRPKKRQTLTPRTP
jgi:peptide deformylase